MTARSFSGHSATGVRSVALALLLAASHAWAADAPTAGNDRLPASLDRPESEAPLDVDRERRHNVRALDPAIFTEISPLTAPDVGIRLPADQEQ